MSDISMFPHMGSGNHGCEAIIRATAQLLRNSELHIFTDHLEEDQRYIDSICGKLECSTDEIRAYTFRHFKSLICKYIFKDSDAFGKETYRPLLNMCKSGDALLCSGGDLYCYDTPEYIYRVNKYVRNNGCKTVLWGCSVEPSYIDEKMKWDLEQYDLICARESITYEALKGINPNTIQTVDPAFILPSEKVKLPAEHYIGVNVSPLIQKFETVPGITMENYRSMIQYILNHTNDSVALIPHVVWKSNDDRTELQKLKSFFPDNDRVVVVQDHNAVQQKYIIAHCRMFIGARTHATIAAYSSCVPTLVVGYSVKAKGIAKDLFGQYEDYVLPVQSLGKSDDLTKSFCWLEKNEERIRTHLESIIPEYIQRTQLAVKAVNDLRRM